MFHALGFHIGNEVAHKNAQGAVAEISTLFQYIPEKNGGKDSKAQLKQDVFALVENGFKRYGFLVEFGAASGVELSNTYLLEKEYGWRGILAEPARMWQARLAQHRTCAVKTDCGLTKTGEILSFDMAEEGEYSTLSDYAAKDIHAGTRKNKTTFCATTISLLDLLKKYNAPRVIDYISIDTEGSEYQIPKYFDFLPTGSMSSRSSTTKAKPASNCVPCFSKMAIVAFLNICRFGMTGKFWPNSCVMFPTCPRGNAPAMLVLR